MMSPSLAYQFTAPGISILSNLALHDVQQSAFSTQRTQSTTCSMHHTHTNPDEWTCGEQRMVLAG
jgi:hypothetical protein